MKKSVLLLIALLLAVSFCACSAQYEQVQIAATTLPVYEFTSVLCEGTGITVGRVVTENVSCLHDYSLQTKQMRMLEGAQMVVISGAGLEDFLELSSVQTVCDASAGIELLCPERHHEEHTDHTHEYDPHIWLSPENAKQMCGNICENLCKMYPDDSEIFRNNLTELSIRLDALQMYGKETLRELKYRELITFHDGFGYFAESFDLQILMAVEEESGREASARELIELAETVTQHSLPAVFTEINGSISAADIIAAETGVSIYSLDMAMGCESYFDAMYHNIETVKEALG